MQITGLQLTDNTSMDHSTSNLCGALHKLHILHFYLEQNYRHTTEFPGKREHALVASHVLMYDSKHAPLQPRACRHGNTSD